MEPYRRMFHCRYIRIEDDGSGPYAVSNFRKPLVEKISALLVGFSDPNRKPGRAEITWESDSLLAELAGEYNGFLAFSIETKNREGLGQLDNVSRRVFAALAKEYTFVDRYGNPEPYAPIP